MVSQEKLIELLRSSLSKKRFDHTMNVAKCARELASLYGADEEKTYRAALFHDMTKELDLENQLKICKKYDIMLDDAFLSMDQLIHPITAAAVARDMGEDEEICTAICQHTLGGDNMSTLSKCVWLADLIEPGRSYSGVDELRMLAYKDLDRAVISAMTRTVTYLTEKGEKVHPKLIASRNALEAKLK